MPLTWMRIVELFDIEMDIDQTLERETLQRFYLVFCRCCWLFPCLILGGFGIFMFILLQLRNLLYHLYLLPSVGLGCRVFFPFNMSSILSSMLFICDFLGNFSLSSLPETGLCRLHQFHVFSTCPISVPSRFIASCADWIPCFTRLEEKGLSLLPLLELDFVFFLI